MGFRRFSHAYTDIVDGAASRRHRGRAPRARRRGAAARASDLSSDRRREARDRAGSSIRIGRCSPSLFWFTVLPGPVGAVLYRAAALLTQEWRGDARGTDPTPIAPGARRIRRAGAALAVAARLDSGASHRAVVRGRRRFRGRGVLLAHAGASWAKEEGGEHVGILLATRGGRAGRRARRPASGARRRARVSPRDRHRRRTPTPTSCPARSASCGARSCCGCC